MGYGHPSGEESKSCQVLGSVNVWMFNIRIVLVGTWMKETVVITIKRLLNVFGLECAVPSAVD